MSHLASSHALGRLRHLLLCTALAGGGCALAAQAAPRPPGFDPPGRTARLAPGQPVSYDLARLVNRVVNEATRYASDQSVYGRSEYWTVADGRGDCEDYALAKRAMLLAEGADPRHLRLATAWTDRREYHLVLVVTTDRGDLVLDARHPEPMPRQALEFLGYRWALIEEGGRWFAVL